MDASSEEATRKLFYGLQLVGLKFPQHYRALYALWSVVMTASVTIYLPFGFLLSWILDIDDFEPSEFLISLQVGINAWSCAIKTIIFTAMQHRFRKAAVYMKKLDARCKDYEELEQIRDVVTFGNRVFIVYQVSYALYSTSTFLTQYLAGAAPYSLYNPLLNWHHSQWEFRTQALLEYFLMSAICFQDVLVDVYPVIYISILRTHIKILTRRVKNLGERAKHKDATQRMQDLVECIKDHRNIIELFNNISTVISGTLFVQFVLAGMVIGTAIINIFIFADVSTIIATSFFLIGVTLETFPICYYGNCLSDDNEELANAVFHCTWYDQELRYKKMLIFFMQNVQKPVLFSAMKIFPITVNSNIQVVKFAFSIYTLIHEMDIGKSYKK